VSSGWQATFRCAADGVLDAIVSERNMKVHVVAALAVALWGSEVPLALPSQLALLLCVALVLAGEVLNTALEALVDLHTRERREEARRVKDAAAGAVLVLALGAACVAAVVAYASLPELLEAATRLGLLVVTDVALLAVAGALVMPRRRPVGLEVILVVLGGAQLGLIALRSVSLPFTAMGAVVFVAIVVAARRSRVALASAEGGKQEGVVPVDPGVGAR
jgi:diacylglycerol kinase